MGRLPGRLFFLLLIAEVVFGLANECLLLLEGCVPRLDAIVSFAFLDAKTSSTVLVFMTRRDEGSFGVLISTLSETIFFFFFIGVRLRLFWDKSDAFLLTFFFSVGLSPV